MKAHAFAALSPTTPLEPFELERREIRQHDVLIEILYRSFLCRHNPEYQSSSFFITAS